MADDLKRVGLVFKADGTQEFKTSMKEINAAIQENRTEFKLAKSAYDDNTTSVKKLMDEQKYLTSQTQAYTQKIEILQEELNQLESAENRDEAAIKRKKSQLNSAQSTLNNYKNSLSDVETKLKDGSVQMEYFDKQIEETNASIKENETNFKLAQSEWTKSTSTTKKLGDEQKFLSDQTKTYTEKARLLQEELKQLENSEERNEQAIREKKQEIAETKTELNNYKNKLSDVSRELESGSAKVEAYKSKVESLGGKVKETGEKFGTMSTAATGMVTAAVAMVPATEEYRKIMAALESSSYLAGYSADQTKETYTQLFGVLGDDQTAATTTANLQALGLSQQQLREMVNGTIGAWAKYGDSIPIDGLAESINETVKTSTVTGTFADVLNWAGTSEDKFNEKLEACGSESERANLVMQELSKQGLTQAGEQWKKNNQALVEGNEATAKLQESTAKLAETLAPIVSNITNIVAELIGKFTGLPEETQRIIEICVLAVAALSPLISGVGSLIGLSSSLFAVIAANPVIAIIAAIVIAVVALYAKCEWFRDGVNAIFGTIGGFLSGAVSTANQKLGEMKAAYEENGGGIKGVVAAAMTGIEGIFSDTYQIINNLTGGKLEECKTAIQSKLTDAKNICSEKLGEMKTAYEENGGGIKGAMAAAMTGVKSIVSTQFSAINTLTGGKLGEMLSTAENKLNDLRQKFTNKISDIKQTVSDGVNKLKGFFDFDWSLPKIKMPHFKINGGFSLDPPKVPSFDVSWYANGGILNRPTIFGAASNGRLLGGGEAGKEAVAPLDTLLSYIRTANSESNDQLISSLSDVMSNAVYTALIKAIQTLKPEIILDDEKVGDFVLELLRKEVFA